MHTLSTTILVFATALSAAALAQDTRVRPQASPPSVEARANPQVNAYRAEVGAYGLKLRLEHRPVGGEEFMPVETHRR